MTPKDVLEYFGTQTAIAHAVGCKQSSVAEWFDKGEVPEGRQYQIELATDGRLRATKPALRNAMSGTQSCACEQKAAA